MKVSSILRNLSVVLLIFLIAISYQSCKKTENPIKYERGTFPDSLINLVDINSDYDDYNSSIYQIGDYTSLVFSSNRASLGGKFDFIQASVSYIFDQTSGAFSLETEIIDDTFTSMLLTAANTSGDDLGPIRIYDISDGHEYFIYSSENVDGKLDFHYLRFLPYFGGTLPDISGPFPVTLLNTNLNDAYLSFDSNYDTVYFSSDIGGNFDIYLHNRPSNSNISNWLNLDYSAATTIDSINSISNDKCPFIEQNTMVFASDRDGGIGGYDLYYSIFKNGKWSSPVNMGPDVNSEYNEYRPIIYSDNYFTNRFMIFSSDRPGVKEGYDLYFKGVNIP